MIRTLTYWMAECLNDSSAFNIRRKTRREVAAEVATRYNPGDYGKPKKVTVEYENALDLVTMCLGEYSAGWEA